MIRILLAEDVELVAEALEALLSTQEDFTVVARVGRGDHVLESARQHRPDLALIDVGMPGMDGIDAAAALLRDMPQCKVLLLSAAAGAGHVHRALAAGASGYLVKSTSAGQLVDAIRTAMAGGVALDPSLAAVALRSGANPLTARESEILALVHAGRTTAQIAAELSLSRGTVRNYLSGAMTTLGVSKRTTAVAVALENGWLRAHCR